MNLPISLILFVLLFALYSCGDSRSQPESQRPLTDTARPQETVPSNIENDPTCCDPVASKELKEAWKAFVENGQFRLAPKAYFKDSEAKSWPSFAYAWGDLGYDRDLSQYYHLAVIVVDESQPKDLNFSVVIFSAPRGAGGKYQPYWLLRNQDLSGAYFSGFSGALGLVINYPEGKSDYCNIRWNNKLKQYQCAKSNK